MSFIIKQFDELTVHELHDIYKLRGVVFIVEQNSAYQDVDEADKLAYHVMLKEGEVLQGYLRVLPKGATYDEVSLGRIIARERRTGIGSRLVERGIALAKEKFDAKRILIGAQTYVKDFYARHGFVQVSDEYLDGGIPHIKMLLEL